MHGNTLKRALVVASVSLTLPVLGAGTALADGGHGRTVQHDGTGSGTTSAPARSAQHGKGTESDPSGSSTNPDGTFQGKGSSTPDQDGKGMDRGADNNDKTGPGTDGNNGCGNEPRLAAPRDGGRPTDDDNNGWCGSKPRPAHDGHPAPAPTTVTSVTTPSTVIPVVTAAALPATTPATAISTSSTSASTSGTAITSEPSLGGGAVSADAVVANAVAGPTALPFTGAPLGLLLLLGGAAAASGAVLTALGRKQPA
jgi:hypothetical protein